MELLGRRLFMPTVSVSHAQTRRRGVISLAKSHKTFADRTTGEGRGGRRERHNSTGKIPLTCIDVIVQVSSCENRTSLSTTELCSDGGEKSHLYGIALPCPAPINPPVIFVQQSIPHYEILIHLLESNKTIKSKRWKTGNAK